MQPATVRGGLTAAILIAALAAPAWAQTGGASAETEPQSTETETETQPAEAGSDAAAGETGDAQSLEGKGYALGDIVLGQEDAPVTVIEYASFTCPHCASFAVETFPELREQYIDTGKVRFILREVYFDQYGLWASMVARCGGEKGFYPLVDSFLSTQATWTRAPDIGHAIQQIGRRAGLPPARLEQCLSDRDFATALLEDYQQHREADEVTSTPTFIIGGEKHTGAIGFEAFSEILDSALEG